MGFLGEHMHDHAAVIQQHPALAVVAFGAQRVDPLLRQHKVRFVRQGAWRIASTATGHGLDNVAFQNDEDGSLVLIATNSAAAPRILGVREHGRMVHYTLPARSVATFRWPAAGAGQ